MVADFSREAMHSSEMFLKSQAQWPRPGSDLRSLSILRIKSEEDLGNAEGGRS